MSEMRAAEQRNNRHSFSGRCVAWWLGRKLSPLPEQDYKTKYNSVGNPILEASVRKDDTGFVRLTLLDHDHHIGQPVRSYTEIAFAKKAGETAATLSASRVFMIHDDVITHSPRVPTESFVMGAAGNSMTIYDVYRTAKVAIALLQSTPVVQPTKRALDTV